jgi:hypothetical protein
VTDDQRFLADLMQKLRELLALIEIQEEHLRARTAHKR